MRMLHIAPEAMFFAKFRNNNDIEYHPIDKSPENYPEGTRQMDLTDLQYEANSFDGIICSHVLEHIPDDKKAMEELFRVLKPGGWAALQVPLDEKRGQTYEDWSITTPEEREKAFGQWDHVRVYGRDFGDRLRGVGFVVTVESSEREFGGDERFRFGLGKESIFSCEKKPTPQRKPKPFLDVFIFL